MRMAAEQMAMAATRSAKLAINIKESEEQQRPSRYPGKPAADPLVQRDSKPGDEHAEERCKEHVPRAGQRRDADRFVPVPALCPGRDHEREPVRGNGRVKKSDAESSERDSGEDRFVHEPRSPLIIRTILEHGEKTSASRFDAEGFDSPFSDSWEKSEPMKIYLQGACVESLHGGAFCLKRASQ